MKVLETITTVNGTLYKDEIVIFYKACNEIKHFIKDTFAMIYNNINNNILKYLFKFYGRNLPTIGIHERLRR